MKLHRPVSLVLLLSLLATLLPLFGCGSKEDKNESKDYYTGPTAGKGTTKNAGASSDK